MTNQIVYVVQAWDSEGNTYNKAFNNEEKAINHYKEEVAKSVEEFKENYGNDFEYIDYSISGGSHLATFDNEKYSENIGMVTLEVN